MDVIAAAKALGFSDAAVMDTKNLVFKPEYRVFCEENLCGCYNHNPACPPMSGTVEEMDQRAYAYEKLEHNQITEALAEQMKLDGKTDLLLMTAGPYKNHSCMSAYCVDAQKMADAVGMICWGNDGKIRYFSQILFHE